MAKVKTKFSQEHYLYGAISIALLLSLIFWIAAISSPGWQWLDDKEDAYFSVGFFHSICAGKSRETGPGPLNSFVKIGDDVMKMRKCAPDNRQERQAWEIISMILLLLAGILDVASLAWFAIVVCDRVCYNHNRCLFFILTAGSMSFAIEGVAVYFVSAQAPQEFLKELTISDKVMVSIDTVKNNYEDPTKLYYSGYLMLVSAVATLIAIVLAMFLKPKRYAL